MSVDLKKLMALIQQGIPICARPYQVIAQKLGCDEKDIINGIETLTQKEYIKRFGVVVKHRKLGYKANAMVVWNIEDEAIGTMGEKLAREKAITLCYQRPRRLPQWPYNLFTMIHGKSREQVSSQLKQIIKTHQIKYEYSVLFSTRCFKQQGANYFTQETSPINSEVEG